MKTWFTADTHFGHAKIIEYCNRPFKNVERMDEALINLWNSRVKEHDLVIHLGDFMFKEINRREYYLDRLSGHITFVRGNHDLNNSLNTKITSLTVHLAGRDIFCTHDPRNYSSRHTLNLVGHVHNKWKVKKIYDCYLVNVGVDVWNYHPVDINEILKAIGKYEGEMKK